MRTQDVDHLPTDGVQRQHHVDVDQLSIAYNHDHDTKALRNER